VFCILNGKSNYAYKLAWIIPIMIFPIFGGLFFLMFGVNKCSNRNKEKMHEIADIMKYLLKQDPEIRKHLKEENKNAANQTIYIERYSDCPVYDNTITEYLKSGEEKFKRMVEELKKAEHYIFLEYFIIDEGVMWNTILEILKEKAMQGVDIRVIYDDVGGLKAS